MSIQFSNYGLPAHYESRLVHRPGIAHWFRLRRQRKIRRRLRNERRVHIPISVVNAYRHRD
jgi:hypothetical protein